MAEPTPELIPAVGSRWVWEIDQPHAVCLVEVQAATWNCEEWWITTRTILRNGFYPTDGDVVQNELSRFTEAVTPVGSCNGQWERRSG